MSPSPAEKSLARVIFIAGLDGWSAIALAAAGTLLALGVGDVPVAFAGLLVIAGGGVELRGRGLLRARGLRGLNWLVGAQLLMLATIGAYAWYRWHSFDAAAVWPLLPALAQDEITRQLAAAGLDPVGDRLLLLEMMNRLVCALLGCLTVLCQGGLALFYRSRHARISEALATPPQSPLA